MPTVRLDPTVGLAVQIALLAILASDGRSRRRRLGDRGRVRSDHVAALTRALRRVGLVALGPANWVTLARATLVGGVARADGGLVLARHAPVERAGRDRDRGADSRRASTARSPAVPGTASVLGARFDMEVDAFLILVLSVYVARSMGAWVLAIGAMRYAYVVATWALAWMRGSLPPRYWRKVVAAIQGVVLAVVAADILPEPLRSPPWPSALVLLVESFGRDVLWLRSRTGRWAGRSASPTMPG